jgi:hypothetical protein
MFTHASSRFAALIVSVAILAVLAQPILHAAGRIIA